jgi:ubiquinone/menaquinone biosynthesis C-methylase UbiE
MTFHKAFYDDPSYDYQSYWQERKYEDWADRIALRKLLKFIRPKKLIVDIGAGFGRLTGEYAPLFSKCILVDPSKRMLQEAKKLTRNFKNISYKIGFSEKVPVQDYKADLVVSIRTFHHLKDPQKAVQEFNRILKKRGFLIIEFPNKIHIKCLAKSIFSFKPKSIFDVSPKDLRRPRSEIPFIDYHPRHIKNLLKKNDFKILKVISASNFRCPIFKKLIPINILLKIEALIQPILAPLNFGPSIFILAQKI